MKKYILVIAIIVLVLASILVFKNFTGKAINENVKEFQVKAFRFGYSPDVIEVSEGDKVKIIIENTDTLHGIRIPDLGIRGDETLEFTADKKGEFTWYCANMCGKEHMQMQGKLIVR